MIKPGTPVPTPWVDNGGTREERMKEAAAAGTKPEIVGVYEGWRLQGERGLPPCGNLPYARQLSPLVLSRVRAFAHPPHRFLHFPGQRGSLFILLSLPVPAVIPIIIPGLCSCVRRPGICVIVCAKFVCMCGIKGECRNR